MKRGALVGVCVVGLIVVSGGCLSWWMERRETREPSRLAFAEYCATCHGPSLEGTDRGPALVDVELQNGDSTPALLRSIGGGYPERGMPGFGDALSPEQIKGLALYVSEQRQGFSPTSRSWTSRLPDGPQRARDHGFRVELVTELDHRPYSIAPLPDGRLLVSEIVRGLSIVDAQGRQGPLLADTPRVWDPILSLDNRYVMMGVVLDVALHPDYAENGWIYLSHTDRCQLDCGSVIPRSMVRVVRGRIRDGRWIDQEIVWSVDPDLYTVVPDNVSAGRLAFDHAGYVYVSIGGKATYDWVQWLDKPTGKIHRVHDDGRLPKDNPFEPRDEVSTAQTVWSYGHRTPQGLATHPETGEIWGTEMGPRGGDEVNRIVRGGNYGWPAREGTECFRRSLCHKVQDVLPPITEYDHSVGYSITGGYVYRGPDAPALVGQYLFGDFGSGRIWAVRREGERWVRRQVLDSRAQIASFAEGLDGALYVVSYRRDKPTLLRVLPVVDPAH